MSSIGVQTKTTRAPSTHAWSEPAARRPDAFAAPSSASRWWSKPITGSPALAAAIAMDVPMRPGPTTATRRSAEVIAKRSGALQVDVRDLGATPSGVEMQEHSNASGQPPLHRHLPHAHEGAGYGA